MFGVYLLVSGFTELFLAFTLPRSAATRVLLFLTGALSIVQAILSFRHFGDIYAVLLLAMWIGIGFIMAGVSESAVAMSERDLPGRGWYVVLGLMSVIAGGVTLVWPFDSVLVLAIVSGVSLAILGVISDRSGFPDPQRHQGGARSVPGTFRSGGSVMTRNLPARPLGRAAPVFARVDSRPLQPAVRDFRVHDMNVTIRLNLFGWQLATFKIDLDMGRSGNDATTPRAFDVACKRLSRRWVRAMTS
jgi:uncharacterized membrane protein HdeD (DUF308 family)